MFVFGMVVFTVSVSGVLTILRHMDEI